jgi:ribosomal-protein-alanine N-acetyltransferase
VAERDGQILGLVGLVLQAQEADVEPIVVLPDERGKRIGRALLARIVEEAKQAGVALLSAKPVARNADALSFFHASGFRTVGHVQLFMELGQTPLCAWKSGLRLSGKDFDY